MRNTDWIDNSNKKAQEEKRYCEKHPIAYWGKTQDGNWYARCMQGFRLNEDCVIGKNE